MNQTFKFHVKFIISYNKEVTTTPGYYFDVDAENSDAAIKLAWNIIRANQDIILKNGADIVNTSEFRMLLDRDGYRD